MPTSPLSSLVSLGRHVSLAHAAVRISARAALLTVFLAPSALFQPLVAQGSEDQKPAASPYLLTVDRIFNSRDFSLAPLPRVHWLKDGESYIDLERSPNGYDIVRIDARSGKSTVLVPGSFLMGANGKLIPTESMTLSDDESKALLFHNTQRVWRYNTKGEYTVVDFATKTIIPVSPGTGPKLFAKFSPDNKYVAFVRDNNIYVFDIATRTERALTTDGAANIINGTSDWVYEEEFDLRDGFRWSPDSKSIAFWRFDQTHVPLMTMVNETDSLYPSLYQWKYPKAGERNSTVQIGVVSLSGDAPVFMQLGNDSTIYVPRMGWVGSDSLWIERMPRKQNRAEVLMASASTGGVRPTPVLVDVDSAYVDVVDPIWFNNNQEVLWTSDRGGWRQIYVHYRNGAEGRAISAPGIDVLEIVGVDYTRNEVYAKVAAPTPTQTQVYAFPLGGQAAAGRRVTPDDGSYEFNMSPTAKFAVATWSNITTPYKATLYELPSMNVVRELANNDKLKVAFDGLNAGTISFIKVPSADGVTMLDGYRIVPPGFDSTKKHPVMMYQYGGPATPQVRDAWMGSRMLFHLMLAQQGYVVVVVDNRGAAWRGTQFRKMTQYNLGIYESDDQIAAAKWIGQQSWGDAERIGLWGWSYGGYNTAMSVFRGGTTFKLGISVAPVSDWRYYDTIYTERFMWLPTDNADGYRRSSALTYAPQLQSKFLLIHGTGDDNVHPQNAFSLAKKLQEARKPFDMMLFPNKTHSISGPGGTLPLYDLLERYIRENL